jgi:hypothetical protein
MRFGHSVLKALEHTSPRGQPVRDELPGSAFNGSHISQVLETVSVAAQYRFSIRGRHKLRIKYESNFNKEVKAYFIHKYSEL